QIGRRTVRDRGPTPREEPEIALPRVNDVRDAAARTEQPDGVQVLEVPQARPTFDQRALVLVLARVGVHDEAQVARELARPAKQRVRARDREPRLDRDRETPILLSVPLLVEPFGLGTALLRPGPKRRRRRLAAVHQAVSPNVAD